MMSFEQLQFCLLSMTKMERGQIVETLATALEAGTKNFLSCGWGEIDYRAG